MARRGRTPAAADGGGEAPAAGEGQKRGFPVKKRPGRDRNAGGRRTLARNTSVSRHLRGNTRGHKQEEGSLLLLFQSEKTAVVPFCTTHFPPPAPAAQLNTLFPTGPRSANIGDFSYLISSSRCSQK